MDELRAELKKRAKQYKNSWFKIGELLCDVKYGKLYRNWSDRNGNRFGSFTRYCAHDLEIGSTVASDMAQAYRYIATHHKELIGSPSVRRKLPGYNEIVMFLRAKNRIYNNVFSMLDEMLFTSQIGREEFRRRLNDLVPRSHGNAKRNYSRIKELEQEIAWLEMRIEELQAEIEELTSFGFHPFTANQLNKIRRSVAKYIHPDAGGNNNVMRDFNDLIDQLLTTANSN